MALLLTITLIYMVLAALFESYMQPVLIMIAVPYGMVGVGFALWAFNKPVSLGVWIGMMILFGTIVNGSIMLVEKINIRREKMKSVLRAALTGSLDRLRSVMMTSLTTILGLVPLVLSTDEAAAMWRSLGLTLLGGLIVGTILILISIPSAYVLLDRFSHWTTTQLPVRIKEIVHKIIRILKEDGTTASS